MGRMDGKVAIITGGASGLGAADAERLAQEGASVVITDVNVELGRKTANSIPNGVFMEHDVRDEACWRRVIGDTVERFGGLHVVVNNAGLVRTANIEDCSLADFRLHYQIMAEGTFLGCKHSVPAIANSGGGAIINIASVAALKADSMLPGYSAAKSAILALTRSVAKHCQERGYDIRVNSVVPGAHETPMTRGALEELPADDPSLEHLRTLGFAQPVELANMVLFLASDEARKINGAMFIVDNGDTMR